MGRELRPRAAAPIVVPKGKVAVPPRAAVPGAEPTYGPAKLRTEVLVLVKVYCATHKLEMQEYLSDLARVDLAARGFVLPVSPPAPDERQPE